MWSAEPATMTTSADSTEERASRSASSMGMTSGPPESTPAARKGSPRLLQLARDVVRYADSRHLRVPVHLAELPVIQGFARQDRVTRRVEQRVERDVHVVARHARTAPAGPFVPVALGPARGDDPARLDALPEKKDAVA